MRIPIPASHWLSIWDDSLAERLIGAEAHDRQSQRIDREFVVLHVFAEDVGDGRRPSFPLHFAVVRRIGEHLLKLNARRIRRLPQIIENDVFDLDIDKRKARIPLT